MKKVIFSIGALALAFAAQAQTIPNAGVETWRTTSSGSAAPVAVKAPTSWFGADSLIIANGQFFGPFLTPPVPASAWLRQLYIDSGANAHSGTYSAKMITKKQDTLGIFPGVLSNAQAHITISLTTGPGPLTYTGGTPTAVGVQTVSAWVLYTQGAALDSGILSAQALARISGVDSVVGFGSVKIGPGTTYRQVTATLTYPVASLGAMADTVRIYFASSTGAHNAVGSTLWVDDVTMTYLPVGINEVGNQSNSVAVYPNPASDILHVEAQDNETVTCNIMSVNGQVIAQQSFTGKGIMDISTIASGLYYYTITNTTGNTTQRGKLSVIR